MADQTHHLRDAAIEAAATALLADPGVFGISDPDVARGLAAVALDAADAALRDIADPDEDRLCSCGDELRETLWVAMATMRSVGHPDARSEPDAHLLATADRIERVLACLTPAPTVRVWGGKAEELFDPLALGLEPGTHVVVTRGTPTDEPTTLHGHVTDAEDFGSEHGDYTTLSIQVAGPGHDELVDHHVAIVDEGDVMDHPDWGRDPSEDGDK